jgi:hypothetical protein
MIPHPDILGRVVCSVLGMLLGGAFMFMFLSKKHVIVRCACGGYVGVHKDGKMRCVNCGLEFKQ